METWNSHSAYKEALLHLEALKEGTGWNAKLRTNLIASARGDRYYQNDFQVVLRCQQEITKLEVNKREVMKVETGVPVTEMAFHILLSQASYFSLFNMDVSASYMSIV